MKMSNDCYRITIRFGNSVEHYFRDDQGWVKTSCRGRQFRMTAEQVFNHLLPALSVKKDKLTLEVAHVVRRKAESQ